MQTKSFRLWKTLVRVTVAAVLVFPPNIRAMTLADAVAYAMEHNRDIL